LNIIICLEVFKGTGWCGLVTTWRPGDKARVVAIMNFLTIFKGDLMIILIMVDEPEHR
jgi:hypothetical protein